MITKENLYKNLHSLEIPDILKHLRNIFESGIIFTTSFSREDQVITDIIFRNDIDIRVVSLDTGRLFEETYRVYSAMRNKYGKEIEIFFPDTQAVEKLLTEKGPYSFYESVENRQECCRIRKVEPLERVLSGVSCWITGLRAGQSQNRRNLDLIEYDNLYNLFKINPLYDKTNENISEYIQKNNVPCNSLYDKGFVSIGCAPCTRAIKPGEDFRAGRWWWEKNTGKECGLHQTENKTS